MLGRAELVDVTPLHHKQAVALHFTQKLRPSPGGGVLLHVLHKAVALGVARKLTVDEKAALDVAVGAYQFLELHARERVRQVGDAQQRVGGLQLNSDVATTHRCLVQ